jgi:HEAT repeat protein
MVRAVFIARASGLRRSCFRTLTSALLLLAFLWAQSYAQTIEPKTLTDAAAEESRELERLNQRLAKNHNYLSGTMWTLTHAYRDKKAVDELMQLFINFFTAVEKKDEATLKKLGGVKGFKQQLAAFLDHKDGTVSGSAAMFLGMMGDERDAAAIAKMLKAAPRAKLKDEDDSSPSIARGRAAIALAILDAREYIPELVKLLRSDNPYDRSGAASALALMKAGTEVKHIAALLEAEQTNPDVWSEQVRTAAIDALVSLGAKEYAPQIAKEMFAEYGMDVKESAIYGVAKLGGREYAGEIAKLLDDSSAGRHAAIALALIGANEHNKKIAQLLSDSEPFKRRAAMLALGILNAKEYAPEIARQLQTGEDWLKDYAALALVLLEARQYRSQIVATLGKSEIGLKANLELPSAFDEERERIRNRLETSYKLLKGNM